MPRYLLETIDKSDGNVYSASTATSEQLICLFPEAYQVFLEEECCVGVLIHRFKFKWLALRITDRERWINISE